MGLGFRLTVAVSQLNGPLMPCRLCLHDSLPETRNHVSPLPSILFLSFSYELKSESESSVPQLARDATETSSSSTILESLQIGNSVHSTLAKYCGLGMSNGLHSKGTLSSYRCYVRTRTGGFNCEFVAIAK